MNQTKLYKGVVIIESLEKPETVQGLAVLKEEYSKESDWHLATVEATEEQVTILASRLKDGPWYTHFWNGEDVIVVFQNKVFRMKHDNKETWKPVLEYGRSIGIPPEQLDFPIDKYPVLKK